MPVTLPMPPAPMNQTAQLPAATYESATARRSRRMRHPSAKLANTLTQHMALLGTAINPDPGMIAEYAELAASSQGATWQAANADEIGCLCMGHGNDLPFGTDTMCFIHKADIPSDKKPTYLCIVCAHRPEKSNPFRV
jgi:hypothetical protein